MSLLFFFFNDTATTEIYTLSLHDALPIFGARFPDSLARMPTMVEMLGVSPAPVPVGRVRLVHAAGPEGVVAAVDRKSTRLNSSHANISYAVFCLKKKKTNKFIHQYSTFYV